jgi:hypothetical protein
MREFTVVMTSRPSCDPSMTHMPRHRALGWVDIGIRTKGKRRSVVLLQKVSKIYLKKFFGAIDLSLRGHDFLGHSLN